MTIDLPLTGIGEYPFQLFSVIVTEYQLNQDLYANVILLPPCILSTDLACAA